MNAKYPSELRTPKEIHPQEKKNIPVSLITSEIGETIVVSRFGDEIWDFYPYIPQENIANSFKKIRWDIKLPDGRKLTDPEHSRLLTSSKDFIWSLFSSPVQGRKRAGMPTLIAKFAVLQPLLRWMIINNLHCFSEIKGNILEYVQFAKQRNNNKETVSGSTYYYRLHIVEYLYHQRQKLDDSIQEHPWPNETALSLTGRGRGGIERKPTTKFIPDDVANKLAIVALHFIRERSRNILPALARIRAIKNIDGVKRTQAQVDFRTNLARESGFLGTNHLNSESCHLRTACYIIIDMFSGIRDSEMMSLTIDCLDTKRSSDDTTDLLFLHGTIYKTGVRAKKWIVPPIIREAVSVLTKLTESLRQDLCLEEKEIKEKIKINFLRNENEKSSNILTKRLHTISKIRNNLFLGKARNSTLTRSLTGHMVNPDLKQFCIDNEIMGADRLAYPLHAHQFRRTYARFIARAELGDLLVLRDHFGHWSLDMTVFYADGAADEFDVDTDLLEMVSFEKNERQTEILGSHLISDAPLANGAQWLKGWRSSVRTAVNKESLIAEYSGTVTLNGTGHSWCVGNGRSIGCGGLCVFEAPMCVDCKYGIIGQEHRPVWKGIRDQQIEAIALSDMGPGGLERAEQILEYAEKVLNRLDAKGVEHD